jgi:hypothetical protein
MLAPRHQRESAVAAVRLSPQGMLRSPDDGKKTVIASGSEAIQLAARK